MENRLPRQISRDLRMKGRVTNSTILLVLCSGMGSISDTENTKNSILYLNTFIFVFSKYIKYFSQPLYEGADFVHQLVQTIYCKKVQTSPLPSTFMHTLSIG